MGTFLVIFDVVALMFIFKTFLDIKSAVISFRKSDDLVQKESALEKKYIFIKGLY